MSRTAPGREHPDAEQSLCPNWCEAQDNTTHWDYPGKCWQTIHEKRFGPVTVFLPQEIPDDKAEKFFIGRAEIFIDETAGGYYPEDAAVLAQSLLRAKAFAQKLDQYTIKIARDGHCETSLDLDGAYPPEPNLQGLQQAQETTQ